VFLRRDDGLLREAAYLKRDNQRKYKSGRHSRKDWIHGTAISQKKCELKNSGE
jgi:hypothetical protein